MQNKCRYHHERSHDKMNPAVQTYIGPIGYLRTVGINKRQILFWFHQYFLLKPRMVGRHFIRERVYSQRYPVCTVVHYLLGRVFFNRTPPIFSNSNYSAQASSRQSLPFLLSLKHNRLNCWLFIFFCSRLRSQGA